MRGGSSGQSSGSMEVTSIFHAEAVVDLVAKCLLACSCIVADTKSNALLVLPDKSPPRLRVPFHIA